MKCFINYDFDLNKDFSLEAMGDETLKLSFQGTADHRRFVIDMLYTFDVDGEVVDGETVNLSGWYCSTTLCPKAVEVFVKDQKLAQLINDITEIDNNDTAHEFIEGVKKHLEELDIEWLVARKASQVF
jgi:hypothetical protein